MYSSKVKASRTIGTAYKSLKDEQERQAALIELEKELERMLIKTVYAPMKQAQLEAIKRTFKATADKEKSNFQSGIKGLAGQLDQTIKGKSAHKISQEVETASAKLHGM